MSMKRDPAAAWSRQPSFGHELRVVLVPLDGSNATEAAIEHGVAIAERSGAALHLAAAANADEAKLFLGEGVEMAQPGSREFAELLEEHVEELARSLSGRCGCAVEPTIITAEDPREGLTDYERRVGVDLTVVGTRVPEEGDDAAWRTLSRAVTREAPAPLLFVPARGTGERETRNGPRAVGALLTDQAIADRDDIVHWAASYARLWEASLLLVDLKDAAGTDVEARPPEARVSQAGGEPPTPTSEARRTRLERVAALLRDAGLVVDTRSLSSDDDWRGELAALLREEAIDTVVTSHAAKQLSEWLLFDGRASGEGNVRALKGLSVLVCPAA